MQVDTKRAFGSKQKSALLFKSNNHCSICNEPIKKDDEVEFNHNHPHSLGGRTDVTNGAVVHKSCNRKLGSKFPELQNIKLRKWQQESIAKLMLKIQELKNKKYFNFTITAEPAAGKTLAICAMAKILKSRDINDFLIIGVPLTSIKRNWVKTAKNIFNMNIVEDLTNVGASRWNGNPPNDIDGIVVTYSQIAAFPDAYKVLASNNKTLFIADEVHHISEELKWGLALNDIFADNANIISCTGTNFRSDKNKINFLDYEESGKVISDVRYNYKQGLMDGVLRPTEFTFFNGSQVWREGEKVIKANFKDKLDKQGKSRILRTALLVNSNGYIDSMIRTMDRKLKFQQMHYFVNAKGLIFAMNQSHARQIAKRVKLLVGETPFVAITDNKTTSKELNEFNDSSYVYCVAVRQPGEGFDAPNISAIGYATNIKQEGPFRQMVARGTRKIPNIGDNFQIANIVLPLDPDLKNFADQFKKDKDYYLSVKADEKKGGGSGERTAGDFFPLSSEAYIDEVLKINIFSFKAANQNREPKDITLEVKERIAYSDEKNDLSNRCNKLVRMIARETGERHQKVHHRCYLDGGKRNDLCSLDDMKFKLIWFENEALRLGIHI